jgi:hypothetical protein
MGDFRHIFVLLQKFFPHLGSCIFWSSLLDLGDTDLTDWRTVVEASFI